MSGPSETEHISGVGGTAARDGVARWQDCQEYSEKGRGDRAVRQGCGAETIVLAPAPALTFKSFGFGSDFSLVSSCFHGLFWKKY